MPVRVLAAMAHFVVGARRHAAALLGPGSDVLGFDTERSTDHGWGPRVKVFVGSCDVEDVRAAIAAGLPAEFRGRPTRFGWDQVPVSHHVEVSALRPWLVDRIGFDVRSDDVSSRRWLCVPQQRLLELVSGAVFHDPGGELAEVRDALAWYPHDVWLWLLACHWRRLDQEEAFTGRAAEVGDELGSRVVATRLVRDLMRLAFLLERRYAPYGKWLGSAFETLKPTVRLFHSRPYRVLGSGRFVDACLARVDDPWLRTQPLIGGVDQISDSTDVLEDRRVLTRIAELYDGATA